MDIYLKKAILHIIDRETGTPVFSEKELDLTTEYIRTYLTAKISKLSTAQTKTGTLAENSSFVDTLRGIPSDFVKKSQEVTQHCMMFIQEAKMRLVLIFCSFYMN